MKLLKKFAYSGQLDWDDKLRECLCAYLIMVRMPPKAMPFCLVYGCEVVLPLKIQIPSLRFALADSISTASKIRGVR